MQHNQAKEEVIFLWACENCCSGFLIFIFSFPSLPPPASQGRGPVRPWGDNLRCHLLPLFLRARPENSSTGGNPPQVSHVGFPVVLGQHLQHVPILRTPRVTEADADKSRGAAGAQETARKFQGTILRISPAAFSLWHEHTPLTHTHPPSQPAWEKPHHCVSRLSS